MLLSGSIYASALMLKWKTDMNPRGRQIYDYSIASALLKFLVARSCRVPSIRAHTGEVIRSDDPRED